MCKLPPWSGEESSSSPQRTRLVRTAAAEGGRRPCLCGQLSKSASVSNHSITSVLHQVRPRIPGSSQEATQNMHARLSHHGNVAITVAPPQCALGTASVSTVVFFHHFACRLRVREWNHRLACLFFSCFASSGIVLRRRRPPRARECGPRCPCLSRRGWLSSGASSGDNWCTACLLTQLARHLWRKVLSIAKGDRSTAAQEGLG